MTKHEYLTDLRIRLQQLPPEEVHRLLHYYAEFIDDAIECGKPEYAAVASLPAPAVVAASALEGGAGGAEQYYNRQESNGAGYYAAPHNNAYNGGFNYSGGFPPSGGGAAVAPPVQPPVAPAPVTAPGAEAKKANAAGAVTAKTIGLFFYTAIVMPLVSAAAVTLLAIWFAFFTAAVSVFISGLAVIVYSFVAGIAGHSFMLFFALLAAGLILLGTGTLCILGIKAATKPVFKAVGQLFKSAVRVYKV